LYFRGYALVVVVQRAQKCLDFSATVYILHLLACSIVGGFPRSWEWWVINIFGMIVMSIFGEYLCMRQEMRDIPMSSALVKNSSPGTVV